VSLSFHAPLLRGVAERLRLPSVMTLARGVGVTGVWRITVHYFDSRAPDTVATLMRRSGVGTGLEVWTERPDIPPITLTLSAERWATFTTAALSLRFDQLADQPNLPIYDTTDLWLIERAAGTFVHSVIVAPALADAAWQTPDQAGWTRLASVVRNGLPEAVAGR